VQRPTRSLQPRRCLRLSGVQSVLLVRTVSVPSDVTVFVPMDWSPDAYCAARKGPWIQAAVDHRRFLRRIQQTEIQLRDILGLIIVRE
jgi:hypothetical protein